MKDVMSSELRVTSEETRHSALSTQRSIWWYYERAIWVLAPVCAVLWLWGITFPDALDRVLMLIIKP